MGRAGEGAARARGGAGQGALGAVAAGLVVARLWGGFCLGDKVDLGWSEGLGTRVRESLRSVSES